MTSANERHAICEGPEPFTRSFERLRIPVDRDEPYPRMHPQQRLGMTAQPHRRVNDNRVFTRRAEVIEYLS